MNFTADQQKVIDARNSNVLVSAAAGSGKTAVLVERIIQMISDEEHPIDIDRLLVVTFTNAAAAEMRERIGQAIEKALEENPGSAHLQKQATLLHLAQITTIDSFCLFLLRNHFQEIGLDPAFRVADEAEIKLLEADVLSDFMEEKYAEGNPIFLKCVETFSPNAKDGALEKHIQKLSKYSAVFPWPEEWLLQRKDDYRAMTIQEFSETELGQYGLDVIRRMLKGWLEKLNYVKSICEEPDGPYMYGEMIESDIEQLERAFDSKDFEEMEYKLSGISFIKLSVKKDESVNGEKRELAKKLRNEVKDRLKSTQESFFATLTSLSMKQQAACTDVICELIDLTITFRKLVGERKAAAKIVDFADMEHFALNILLKKDEEGNVYASEVAKEYRSYFQEILIDEYQDSNPIQEYLLSAVSGEDEGRYNRFMVGDLKQSIYKFRLASPELFLEKYRTYLADGDKRRIDLSMNFRSRQEVIDSVNQVFSRIMSEDKGGIAYDEKAALYYGATTYPASAGNETEIHLVEAPGKEEEDDAKTVEARLIARRIKELMQSFQVTDKKTNALRPLRFSDIVILLRSASGYDETFSKVLQEEGVPVFISSKSGYFSQSEVQTLLQMLRVLDNSSQDVALFGVMKSIFGGFTDEEIAIIRSNYKEGSLQTACKQIAEEDSELGRKTSHFLEEIGTFRKYKSLMTVRELLTAIIDHYNYLNYVTALPAGGKRRANVEMLLTRASDFEQTSYYGLFHFLRFMEQLEKYEVDYGEADTLDENADVVRIMTIHKSKGLEFPVTFVSAIHKKFNFSDTREALQLHMDYGIGCDYADVTRRMKNKTLRKTIISAKIKEEMLAEELRVLYVALTRAKEKLILTGVEKGDALIGNQENLTFADFFESTCYKDFLLPILGQTDIQIQDYTKEDKFESEIKETFSMLEKKDLLIHAKDNCNTEIYDQLTDRLAQNYPHPELAGLYTKTTVSELKIAAMADADEAAYHTFEEAEVLPYIPSFKREESKGGGALRGTAVHRVMELLDFAQMIDANPKKIEEELKKLVETGRLKEEYYELIDLRKIEKFLSSELGHRVGVAQKEGVLYKEQPFFIGIPASKVNKDFPEEETVLVQGIIDVFWEEKDGIVLLDYKTDSVQKPEDLIKRYETQLKYYKEAIERSTGLPVKESILYSFKFDQPVVHSV